MYILAFIILGHKISKEKTRIRNSSTQVKQCSSSVQYKLVVVNSDPINDILAKTNMECTVPGLAYGFPYVEYYVTSIFESGFEEYASKVTPVAQR